MEADALRSRMQRSALRRRATRVAAAALLAGPVWLQVQLLTDAAGPTAVTVVDVRCGDTATLVSALAAAHSPVNAVVDPVINLLGVDNLVAVPVDTGLPTVVNLNTDGVSGCVYDIPETSLDWRAGLVVNDARVTLNGNGSTLRRSDTSAQYTVLLIAGTSDVQLNDATITNGAAPMVWNRFNGSFAEGGGILNYATLTLRRCTVTGNTAEASPQGLNASAQVVGAGIANQGSLTLVDSTVRGNTATALGTGTGGDVSAAGGGISGAVTMHHSTVSGNAAIAQQSDVAGAGGGGVAGNVTMDASAISDNTAQAAGITSATAEGGGVGSALTLRTGSVISGNRALASADGSATALGGGGAGLLDLRDSTVRDNVAEASLDSGASATAVARAAGGGVLAQPGSVLRASTLSGNSAQATRQLLGITDGVGGGLDVDSGGVASGGSVDLRNSTVAGNTASSNGGGIAVEATAGRTSLLDLVSGSVTGNQAGDGGGIWLGAGRGAALRVAFSGNAPDNCAGPQRVAGCSG